MKWNAELYDSKHDFVAEYGKGLFEYIPSFVESILDLGCGTGTLTNQLTGYSKHIVGIDHSKDMIDKARLQYPDLDFRVENALDLPFSNEFDLVFSNAVFHWIHDHDLLLDNIYKVLKDQGMLICEFGAIGNIGTIDQAFQIACKEIGYCYSTHFNFQSPETFSILLEKHHFQIEKIYAFDRPTPLKDQKDGLINWMKQFYAADLNQLSDHDQIRVLQRVEELTRDSLWNGKEWVADYKRLRVIARKRYNHL